jgi:hypothetical protein
MQAAVRVLREKLGDQAMSALETVVDNAAGRWKDEMLSIAGERFERRLAEQIGAFRTDAAKEFAAVRTEMASEFAAVRTEMASEFAAVRTEMASQSASIRLEMGREFGALRIELATTRTDLLKWAFLFWIGQFAAVSGMMALLLRTIVSR